MQFAFRTDASLQIGAGHVMRCLTLADALRECGVQSTFICRAHTGHLLDLVHRRGHAVIELAPADEILTAATPSHGSWLGTDWVNDANQTCEALGDKVMDWLVVDHYALDARWEKTLAPYYRKLMVIDDLADRPHVCDILLDQTFGRDKINYDLLVPAHCRLLCGSQYALLRPEFAALREYSLQRRAKPVLKEVLVNMGGVDKDNVTGRILKALHTSPLPADCRITVVMGVTAPWLDEVRVILRDMPWQTRILVGVDDMAQLMANSDLAIGAAGATSWERCCLGLPSIVLTVAENQRLILSQLAKVGAVFEIDLLNKNYSQQLSQIIESYIRTTEPLKISQIATSVVDGMGVIRVQKILNEYQ